MTSSGQCSTCDTALPPHVGKGRPRLYCQSCAYARRKLQQGDYDRVHKAKRYELVRAAKDRPCVDCGIKYPPVCMDLDHVRGDKAFVLSRGASQSMERLRAEIAKCDVRCANCHRLRHYNENANHSPEHDTLLS